MFLYVILRPQLESPQGFISLTNTRVVFSSWKMKNLKLVELFGQLFMGFNF